MYIAIKATKCMINKSHPSQIGLIPARGSLRIRETKKVRKKKKTYWLIYRFQLDKETNFQEAINDKILIQPETSTFRFNLGAPKGFGSYPLHYLRSIHNHCLNNIIELEYILAYEDNILIL